jgi:heme exporter protein C
MHIYANPARFLKIARPLTGWLGWSGAALIAAGLAWGLSFAPEDYLQGDSVRIMYVHLPHGSAWAAGQGSPLPA